MQSAVSGVFYTRQTIYNKANQDDMAQDKNDFPENKGMELYEYIVDNVDALPESPDEIVAKLRAVDNSGQFFASTARFLAAVDRERYEKWLTPLIEGAIERDRERRYIGSLLEAIWGADYEDRLEQLRQTDNNFRRIYRRIHPEDDAM